MSIANPWYLITLSFAEYLYHLSARLFQSPLPFTISHVSLAFYNRFIPAKEGQVIQPFSVERKRIVKGQRALADGFLAVVREFTAWNGSLSEQFDRLVVRFLRVYCGGDADGWNSAQQGKRRRQRGEGLEVSATAFWLFLLKRFLMMSYSTQLELCCIYYGQRSEVEENLVRGRGWRK